MRINSKLVSAQSRDRFYVFNWEVEQPEDRWIFLKDILETGESWQEKSYCVTGTISKSKQYRIYSENYKSVTICGEGGGLGAKTGLYSIQCNYNIPNDCSIVVTENSIRCQRRDAKHSTVQGTHVNFENGKSQTVSVAHVPKIIVPSDQKIYEVIDGMITIKGKKYPINLKDGYYVIRKLTPVECERLQTLPDGYTSAVSNTQRYRGLGNGWTAEVIIHILQGALKDVPKDEKILVLSMYDGIGTGRYCLDKMGFENVEYHAYEIDKYAIKVATSNYADIIQHGDAFQVREEGWGMI